MKPWRLDERRPLRYIGNHLPQEIVVPVKTKNGTIRSDGCQYFRWPNGVVHAVRSDFIALATEEVKLVDDSFESGFSSSIPPDGIYRKPYRGQNKDFSKMQGITVRKPNGRDISKLMRERGNDQNA